MSLTTNDIAQLETSRQVLRHVIDDEPANKKLAGWEILLWSLDTLTAILVRDGKYQKPRLFGYFKLAKFALDLIHKINASLKEKNRMKPIQQ